MATNDSGTLCLEIPSLGVTHSEGDGILVLDHDQVIGLISGELPAMLRGKPLNEMADRVSTMGVLDEEALLSDQINSAAAAHGEEVSDMAFDLLAVADKSALLEGQTWYLSAGETTLARLAVGLARPFELLILAEPAAGLDLTRRRATTELLEAVAVEHLVVVSEG